MGGNILKSNKRSWKLFCSAKAIRNTLLMGLLALSCHVSLLQSHGKFHPNIFQQDYSWFPVYVAIVSMPHCYKKRGLLYIVSLFLIGNPMCFSMKKNNNKNIILHAKLRYFNLPSKIIPGFLFQIIKISIIIKKQAIAVKDRLGRHGLVHQSFHL